MGYACEIETSILLARHPDMVDTAKAMRGGPSEERGFRTIDMLKGVAFFMINEFDDLSETGVMGMPDFATSDRGE